MKRATVAQTFTVFRSSCKFVMVEFTEEKEIEVVPYIWLREGENVAGHHLDHHRKNKLLWSNVFFQAVTSKSCLWKSCTEQDGFWLTLKFFFLYEQCVAYRNIFKIWLWKLCLKIIWVLRVLNRLLECM